MGFWALGFAISFTLGLFLEGLAFVLGPVVALALSGLAMLRLLRNRSNLAGSGSPAA
jgi:hypothetical protein